jgi:hypothetical protein
MSAEVQAGGVVRLYLRFFLLLLAGLLGHGVGAAQLQRSHSSGLAEEIVRLEAVAAEAIAAKAIAAKAVAAEAVPAGRPVINMAGGAESAVNPRLANLLDAWRAYKAGGDSMEMQEWVQATQRQYGGVSGGYRSGFGDWFTQGLESVHGNSLAAKGPHDVYAIMEAGSDRVLHFGETGRGYLTRFAEHQRAFDEMGIDIEVQFHRTVDGKAAAKVLESRYIKTFERYFGTKPPFNLSTH